MSIYLYNEVYTIQAPCKSRMGLGLMDWYDGATNEFSSIQDIVPDMTGKIIVITGANSGIGLVTTLQLAHKMAHIYMLCRSESKALTEIEKIILQTSNRNIHFIQCDLSDWPSIIAASMKLKSLINHIDVLINNAGILGVPIFTECNQGVELHMSSNHFGHYILTRELLPLIVNSKSSRIVNVSSNVHASAKVSKSYFSARQAFNYDILKKESYFSYASYCHSKLANVLFTVQLQRNLEEQGITHVHVNAVHPGVISTNILSAAGMNWMNPLLSLVRSDVETGAMTQLYCATHPNIVLKELKGLYFVPIGKVGKMSDAVTDFEGVEKFWKWSEGVLKDRGFQSDWSYK